MLSKMLMKAMAITAEIMNFIRGNWMTRTVQVVTDVVTSKVFTARMEVTSVPGYRYAAEYVRTGADAANIAVATTWTIKAAPSLIAKMAGLSPFVAKAVATASPYFAVLMPYLPAIAIGAGVVMAVVYIISELPE